MATAPKPLSSQTASANTKYKAKPVSMNGTIVKQAAIANQATFTVTDFPTADAAVDTLAGKINAILTALRAAGVILP